MVVGVVVDDTAFEALEARDDLVAKVLDVSFDQLAPGRLGDLFGKAPEIVRALDVPGVVTVRARMVEVTEGQIEAGEGAADLLEERGRSFAEVDQGRAVQEGEDTDPTASLRSSMRTAAGDDRRLSAATRCTRCATGDVSRNLNASI